MTETEFRIKYSELIEHYQYIEERLKYICMAIIVDEQNEWLSALHDVEFDYFGILVTRIQSLQTQKKIDLLSREDIEELDKLRKTRNYWVHQCFGGLENLIIFKNGELKNPAYGKKISNDLSEAIRWEKKLADIKVLAKKNKR